MKKPLSAFVLCILLAAAACTAALAQYQIEGENILTDPTWTVLLNQGGVASAVSRLTVSEPYSLAGGGIKIIDDQITGDSAKIFIHKPSSFAFNGSATAVVRVKTTADQLFSALANPPTSANPWSRTFVLRFPDDPGLTGTQKKGIGLCIRPDRAAVMSNTGTTRYGDEILGDNTRYVTWTIVGRNYGANFDLYRNWVQVIANGANTSNTETPLGNGVDGVYLSAAPNVTTGSWIFDCVAFKAGEDPAWNPWPATLEMNGYVVDQTSPSTKIVGATVTLSTGETATTDSEGFFRFTNLYPEQYSVKASADGYLNKTYSNVPLTVTGSPATQIVRLLPVPAPTTQVFDTFSGERTGLGTTEDSQNLPWNDGGEVAAGTARVTGGQLTLDLPVRTHGISIGGGFLPANIEFTAQLGPIVPSGVTPSDWGGIAYRQDLPCTYDTWNGQSAEQAGYLIWCPWDGTAINLWRNGLIASYAPPGLGWGFETHQLKVRAFGGTHEVWLDGTLIIEAYDTGRISGGYVGILRDAAQVSADSVTVNTYAENTLTGTAFDAANPSVKLAGAFVLLSDGRSVVTNGNGQYTVPVVSFNPLTLRAIAAGYGDKVLIVEPAFGVNTVDLAMDADPAFYNSIGDAKAAAPGSQVSLFGKAITAQWRGTTMSVEDPDRSSGILVMLQMGDSALASKIGKTISLRGTLQVDSMSGEKYLQLGSWHELGVGSIGPVFATSKSLAKGAGLDMTGLYVKAIGKVTWVDPAARSFTINDGGTDVMVWVDSSVPILAWPALDDWIEVDGIAGLSGATPETAVRVIKPWNGDTNYLGSWASNAPNNPGIEGTWSPYDTGCGPFPTPSYWGVCVYNGAGVTAGQGTDNPHGGTSFARFSNTTPCAPNVYGRLFQLPGPPPPGYYEFSCWIRGIDVSDAGGCSSHWIDWNNTSWALNVPSGTYGWKRIQTKFYSPPGQPYMNLGINVVNMCTELCVDDVMIRPAKGIFTWISAP